MCVKDRLVAASALLKITSHSVERMHVCDTAGRRRHSLPLLFIARTRAAFCRARASQCNERKKLYDASLFYRENFFYASFLFELMQKLWRSLMEFAIVI